MLLKDWNLVSEQRVLGMETVIVKIRYRKQANHCRVALMADGCLRVSLLEPLEAIAPGQAAAFYDADGLLLAVVSFFEIQFQHFLDVLSCIAEAGNLVLSAEFAFAVQPVVEQVLAGHDYLQRL